MATVPPEVEEGVDLDEPRDLSGFNTRDNKPASIHNFQGDAMAVWELVSFAKGASCRDGSSLIDQTLPLKWWMVHEVVVNNPDKGPVKAVRTVLMDPSMNAYGFVSNGIYDSLRDLIEAAGPGPYDPAVNVAIRQRQKQSGRKVYTLEPAPRRQEEPPK